MTLTLERIEGVSMMYFVQYEDGGKRRISRESAKQTLRLGGKPRARLCLFEEARAEAKRVGRSTRCVPGLTQVILVVSGRDS